MIREAEGRLVQGCNAAVGYEDQEADVELRLVRIVIRNNKPVEAALLLMTFFIEDDLLF